MKHALILKTIIMLLIQTLLLSNIAWAQNFDYISNKRDLLSAPINISSQDFKNIFLEISDIRLPKISFKETTQTFLNKNKYSAAFSSVLLYETINLISKLISTADINDIYASIFIINILVTALIISKSNLFAPESLLKVLPMQEIMSDQNIFGSYLIKSDSKTVNIAAKFLAHAKISRFEWGITIAQRKNTTLNLISQGTSIDVQHSFLSHLIFSSRKIKTVASLHTHPFENPWNNLNLFPSPNDFERSNKIKRENNADNYLLIFSDKNFPVLMKYHRSLSGENIVTHFVFGERNVIAVLSGILASKNFNVIAKENPQTITAHIVKIICTQNQSGQYYLDFFYLPTQNKQLLSLLNFNKKIKPEFPKQAADAQKQVLEPPKKIWPFVPILHSFHPQYLQEQKIINLSV